MPTKHGFPRGPEAAERRFRAAFEGLTARLCAPRDRIKGRSVDGEISGEDLLFGGMSGEWHQKWEEMFNTLIDTEEEDGK